MKFLTKILNRVEAIGDDIGEGFVKLAKVVGRGPSDAKLDQLNDKGKALIAKIQALASEELDNVPGVPTVAAQLVAQAAGAALNALLAGSIEGAKAANTDK